ncbi:DinB family protein [uncultured Aquimarina sp.]|uniref:DinB family protein n=1 Tax=uncultured Aquimarina sp. TaxID=575652 RepID=UPI00262AF10D|nr:DinB family protein [uncultured Aquimarina sp.]
MAIATKKLLQDLLEITRANLNGAEQLKKESVTALNWKPASESWSALECIEHLNRYGDFYIPEITAKIQTSTHKPSEIFKSNWLGTYFSKSVSYNENVKKMKTFTSMNPLHSELDLQTIDKFIHQQHQILALLDQSKNVNLDKTKTAISISRFIKLRLGDTFRVVIYHNERHMKQAEKAIKMSIGNKLHV